MWQRDPEFKKRSLEILVLKSLTVILHFDFFPKASAPATAALNVCAVNCAVDEKLAWEHRIWTFEYKRTLVLCCVHCWIV